MREMFFHRKKLAAAGAKGESDLGLGTGYRSRRATTRAEMAGTAKAHKKAGNKTEVFKPCGDAGWISAFADLRVAVYIFSMTYYVSNDTIQKYFS